MFKSVKWALASFLLVSSFAAAQEATLVVIDNKLVKVESVVQPKVSIVSPVGVVDLGEIVKLEGKVEGELPAYVKDKKYKWTVTERGYVKQFWEQDNWVIFGTGVKSTTIRISCEVTLTYQLEKEEIIKKVEAIADIQVGQPGPGPDPGPGPGPDPDPKPPVPEPELTGLAKLSRDWAVEVGPVHKVQSSKVIADTLNDIATRIGHDLALTGPRSILTETKKEINEAVKNKGYNPTDWDPWGVKLQEYAFNEYQAGKMRTIEEYKAAWIEISTGLKAVK